MASKLPTFVVLQPMAHNNGRKFVIFHVDKDGHATVKGDGRSVFDPLAKIEIEASKVNPEKLIHLRFVHTNKYWSVVETHPSIVALLNKPEEDESSQKCTLFRPQIDGDKLYLFHVYSNKPAIMTLYGLNRHDDFFSRARAQLSEENALLWTNIAELVQLPKMVAFKGVGNKKYLKSVNLRGYNYLQFSGDDPNGKETAHGVEVMDNGNIRIKSLYFERYWRLSPTWIWADTTDKNDEDAWFRPIKVGGSDNNQMVLRNVGNGRFCRRLTADGKDDCLNANVDSMTNETRLEMEELVSERKLHNVRFMPEYGRVFDESVYVATEATATNDTDQQSQFQMKLSKVEKITHTFSAGASMTLGFKITVNAGPDAVKLGSSEISGSITGTFTMGKATEESTTEEAISTVTLPKRSKAICKMVGTKGTVSIPFSYTQEDKSSYDGQVTKGDHIDGIYTGVKFYGFKIHVGQAEPL